MDDARSIYSEPTKPFRLAVCGGRDYFDTDWIVHCLDQVHKKRRITLLIHGDAPGADTIAAQWCVLRQVPRMLFVADWKAHGRAAGPMRNAEMVRQGLDGLVAFPGGRGTADMTAQCRAASIELNLDSAKSLHSLLGDILASSNET